ncbi:hypothetical protein [Alloprevotella tannerae]|nr:hypothetical protein [Alloprevotella tannerae]
MSIHYYSPLANEVTNAGLLLLPFSFAAHEALSGVKNKGSAGGEIEK